MDAVWDFAAGIVLHLRLCSSVMCCTAMLAATPALCKYKTWCPLLSDQLCNGHVIAVSLALDYDCLLFGSWQCYTLLATYGGKKCQALTVYIEKKLMSSEASLAQRCRSYQAG